MRLGVRLQATGQVAQRSQVRGSFRLRRRAGGCVVLALAVGAPRRIRPPHAKSVEGRVGGRGGGCGGWPRACRRARVRAGVRRYGEWLHLLWSALHPESGTHIGNSIALPASIGAPVRQDSIALPASIGAPVRQDSIALPASIGAPVRSDPIPAPKVAAVA